MKSIKGMAVNKVRCHSCPFNENGAKDVRASVEARCLSTASQLCHGTDNKTLCRGARDFQLQMFYRMGFLSAPTDAAWKQKAEGR